MEQIFRTVYFV